MSSIGQHKLSLSAIVLQLLFAIWPAAIHSQSCCSDFRFELLQTQQMAIQFQQRLLESRAWRDRERRNVPVYNARLNGFVLAFHKHIIKDDQLPCDKLLPLPKVFEPNQILFEETGPGDEVIQHWPRARPRPG